MLSVSDAFNQLLLTVVPFKTCELPIGDSLGLTLGRDILSRSDSPPFDKSLMDGYAVHSADLVTGSATLRVIEVITAGQVPTKKVERGQATQIMTGAPLPDGADTVIKIEETKAGNGTVTIQTKPPSAGANLIRKGASIRTGDRVMNAGDLLNASRIGALAELGYSTVTVRPRPRVAILATGDELVEISANPGPGQIRNSNSAMLAAQITAMGCPVIPLGIARDHRENLRSKIDQGLQADLLILSGGVSAGTLDLVPATLSEAGVVPVFHQVEMKPGKPIWFGVRPGQSSDPATRISERDPCYVFGLPGNPVSSLVCCELFVRTAIRQLMGTEPAKPSPMLARLEHSYSNRADRPTYHPAKLNSTHEGLTVALVPWHGSSDLCGTVAANGMACLPGEAHQYQAGDQIETLAW